MSFLPGLGPSLTINTPLPAQQTRTIHLNAGCEFRFEIPFTTTTTIKLLPSPPAQDTAGALTGTAEIFGTELSPGREYAFCGAKAAVYTHHGCSLAVTGACESEYVAEETPVPAYANVHLALEDMRIDASQDRGGDGGPRVLVVGPEDAGKSSLVKTLAAYAMRAERTPLVVSLDSREAMLCLPGAVSAAVLGGLLDVEDGAGGGWGSSPVAGPTAVPVKMPLVYHIGCERPEERPDVFRPVVARLALAATSRFEEDPAVREAGLLVDTAGSVGAGAKAGDEVLAHVVSEFSINVILVLGSERLYSNLARRFATPAAGADPSDAVRVLKLPKSGGCVDRDAVYLRALRQAQIRAYFFGSPANPLSPYTQLVDADAVHIFRMSDPQANDGLAATFLPGGGGADDDDGDGGYAVAAASAASGLYTRVTPLPSGGALPPALANAILAVKHASPSDTDDVIRDSSVMGYLYVADVDEARRKLRILAPAGGRLPPRALVWGTWPEGVGDLAG